MNSSSPSPSAVEACSAPGFFAPRWRRVLAGGLAVLVLLIGMFYGVEDWGSRRAWDAYRQGLEARGVQLEFASYIPPAIPDGQNFATSSAAKSWLSGPNPILSDDEFSRTVNTISTSRKKGEKSERRFMDLVAWQRALAAIPSNNARRDFHFESGKFDLASRAAAAPDVLAALKSDADAFGELRAASVRPMARYPLKYADNLALMLLPHLGPIRNVCSRLQLKACTELALGQNDQALPDVKLILYLADSLKAEPTVLEFSVRISCLQLAMQPIWEGLAEHRWTDAQLAELQAQFAQYDFLAAAQLPLSSGRAAALAFVDYIKTNGLTGFFSMVDDESTSAMRQGIVNSLGFSFPSGWFYREKLNYCTLFDTQQNGTIDPTAGRVMPSRVAANAASLSAAMGEVGLAAFRHHRFIASFELPSTRNIPWRAATAQTIVNQCLIACALERSRLADGHFPENLEALAPRFIPKVPNDVITGQPYKYRRTDGGQMLLYSVGWNEKDDGGVPGTDSLFEQARGDWVWTYPPLIYDTR